jgi:hypothetical protein
LKIGFFSIGNVRDRSPPDDPSIFIARFFQPDLNHKRMDLFFAFCHITSLQGTKNEDGSGVNRFPDDKSMAGRRFGSVCGASMFPSILGEKKNSQAAQAWETGIGTAIILAAIVHPFF